MRIILIRHGQTPGNLRHAYIGSTDEPLLPRELRRIHPLSEENVTRLFVSPMKRCLMTAQSLFPDLVENGSCRIVDGFREMDFGDFEGKCYADLNGNPAYQAYIDSGGESAFPHGESRSEFKARVTAAAAPVFDELLAREIDHRDLPCGSGGAVEMAAFVIHGGTIMAILDAFSDPHREYFDWQTPCLTGFTAELTGGENFYLREVKPWSCL